MGCVKTSINPDPWIRIPVLLNKHQMGSPFDAVFNASGCWYRSLYARAYNDRDSSHQGEMCWIRRVICNAGYGVPSLGVQSVVPKQLFWESKISAV